jgi:hypothetical protein
VIGKITAPSNPLSAQRRHPFGHESIAPPEGDGPILCRTQADIRLPSEEVACIT